MSFEAASTRGGADVTFRMPLSRLWPRLRDSFESMSQSHGGMVGDSQNGEPEIKHSTVPYQAEDSLRIVSCIRAALHTPHLTMAMVSARLLNWASFAVHMHKFGYIRLEHQMYLRSSLSDILLLLGYRDINRHTENRDSIYSTYPSW